MLNLLLQVEKMRDNFARIYEAMGFGRWFGKSETDSIEYFSKAKNDKIEPHECIAADNINEPNLTDPKYIYWLVSDVFSS